MNLWGRVLVRYPWPRLHVRTLMLLVLLSLLFIAHLFDFTDPDLFMHLRSGQYIWETGSIPSQDPFSYTAGDRPWIMHEWLSQVLSYLMVESLNYGALVLFYAALTTLAFYVQHRLLVRLGIHEILATFLVLWAGLLIFPFFTARPLTFTWLFFVLFLHILYSYHRGQDAPLWLLPLVMVLWVNLHGGFVIGYILMLLLLVVRLVERRFLTQQHRLLPLAATLGLTVLGTLINPNLVDGFIYPFTYFGGDNASLEFVSEWQSPDFHELYWMLFFVSVILLLLGLGVWSRRLGWWPLGVMVVVALMALQSVRHIPIFALAAMPILGEVLAERFPWARSGPRRPQRGAENLLNWSLLALFWGAAVLIVPRLPNYHVQPEPLPTRGVAYPEAGAEFILEHYPEARIFNMYYWGGYLLHRLYPTQQVFIDGRADLYGYAFVKDYFDTIRLRPGWQGLLERYQIDLIIFERDTPFAEALRLDSSWEQVFSGPDEVIFVRRQPPSRE